MKPSRLVFGLLFTLPLLGADKLAAEQSAAMLEYPFLCPSCDTARSVSVRYGERGLSVLEAHETGTPPLIHPDNDAPDTYPGSWIASPDTGFRPGNIQRWEGEVGTDFIEVQTSSPLEEGKRYGNGRRLAPAEPGRPSWSIHDVSIELKDGGRPRTVAGFEGQHVRARLQWQRSTWDRSGEPDGSENHELLLDLWFSASLPFSPLPFEHEPFKGNHVPPYLSGPVADHLMHGLRSAVKDRGGLLRAEVVGEADAVVSITRHQAVAPLEAQRYAGLPVVASDRVDEFSGPLFLTSLLRDGMLGDGGRATFAVGDRSFSGRSAWKLNEAGDLVIALAAADSNTTLLLVRPAAGLPEEERYGVSSRPDMSTLRAMDDEAMLQHIQRFQLYGVITSDDELPRVLTSMSNGQVALSEVSGEVIAGEVSAEASVLATDTSDSPLTQVPVRLRFEALEGLDGFRFRSPEARLR